MDIAETFELIDSVSEYDLKKIGFKNGIYKCFIYKDILQFIIDVEINKEDGNSWAYQIYNADTQSIYAAYYNREYGSYEHIKEIDKSINKVMNKLVKAQIFKKR